MNYFISAVPIVEENTYIVDIEYSPLIGGFAIVLNDGRAAFLTASSLKFDPNVSIFISKWYYAGLLHLELIHDIKMCKVYLPGEVLVLSCPVW